MLHPSRSRKGRIRRSSGQYLGYIHGRLKAFFRIATLAQPRRPWRMPKHGVEVRDVPTSVPPSSPVRENGDAGFTTRLKHPWCPQGPTGEKDNGADEAWMDDDVGAARGFLILASLSSNAPRKRPALEVCFPAMPAPLIGEDW